MTAARYRNSAQQRVLRTLRLLADVGRTGASPSEVATGIGTLRSNTTRDLANLRMAGLATTSNGRWYASYDAAGCLHKPPPATAETPRAARTRIQRSSHPQLNRTFSTGADRATRHGRRAPPLPQSPNLRQAKSKLPFPADDIDTGTE